MVRAVPSATSTIAGRGVANLGVVPRAARLIDVAPTITSLLGCAPLADGRFLSRQDGVVREVHLLAQTVAYLRDDAVSPVTQARREVGSCRNRQSRELYATPVAEPRVLEVLAPTRAAPHGERG